jgi:hypothetical protein
MPLLAVMVKVKVPSAHRRLLLLCFRESFIYLGVSEKDLVDIMRRVLDELVVGVEDNKANLAVAEDTQLHRLLHQSEPSLLKGDL